LADGPSIILSHFERQSRVAKNDRKPTSSQSSAKSAERLPLYFRIIHGHCLTFFWSVSFAHSRDNYVHF
jgi:hypothetical protein